MAGSVSLRCEKLSINSFCERTDIVFIALPHKIAMQIVPEFISRDKKVIDLSADFRFKNILLYESFYQEHAAPDLLYKSVYGLCEIL